MKKIVSMLLCIPLFFAGFLFADKGEITQTLDNIYEKNAPTKKKRKDSESAATPRQVNRSEKKNKKNLKRKGWEVINEGGDDDSASKIQISKKGQNIGITQGIAKIQTIAQNGSVAFYIADKKNLWLPIIEMNDFADSTYISLYIDGTEYRMNRSKQVDYVYEVGDDFVSVVYRIEFLIQLNVTYKFAKVDGADSILVSYSLVNMDTKPHSFSLKVVYNSVLGENRAAHFSIASVPSVNVETVITPSPQENFVVTSDGKRSVRYVIYGKGIHSAEKVVLANKDIIEDSNILTAFRNGRSFSSILSYNNSSIGFFWRDIVLGTQSDVVYYRIDFSSSEMKGDQDDADISEPLPPAPKQEEPVIQPVSPPEPTPPEPTPPAQDLWQEPKENLNYDFNTERNYFDPAQIDEAYVQRLVDEIDSLEHSDPTLNRERIQKLQKEIDEVLEVLRSRR